MANVSPAKPAPNVYSTDPTNLDDDNLVLEEAEPDIENQEHLQLTLEEAFFLKYTNLGSNVERMLRYQLNHHVISPHDVIPQLQCEVRSQVLCGR